jgi:hypothetical protein
MTDLSVDTTADMWYLVYRDEDAVVHIVKGTMNGIRRSLKEGLLGDAGNVRVSRNKSGPFESLKNHPEFRDLVVEPAPLPGPGKRPATPTAAASTQPDTLPFPPEVPEPPRAGPVLAEPDPGISVFLPVIHPAAAHSEWLKWSILLFLALSTGVAGYFLLPILSYLRLL